MPNRHPKRRGLWPNWNEWLLDRITRLPKARNAPNDVLSAQDIVSSRWLTPPGTVGVQKSLTNFWMRNAQISTPLGTDYPMVAPIASNAWCLFESQHDRRFWLGISLIFAIRPMSTGLSPLFPCDGQGVWGYKPPMRCGNRPDGGILTTSTRFSQSLCK